jgi:hypothetical protein
MFDQLFKSPRAINHHSTRPLLEERLRYLAYRAAQGSTRSSLRLRCAPHAGVCRCPASGNGQ